MRVLKGGIAAASLTLGLGVLYTHQTGSLYPGLAVGILAPTTIILLTLFLAQSFSRRTFYVFLVATVLVAVFYRAYTFSFPASLLGMDPDGYALGIERLIRSGRTSAIEIGFYDQAPLFYVLPAILSHLSSEPASKTLILYPILVGTLLPTTAAVLTRWVLRRDAYREAVVAALGAAVATTTVWFSYWPIAQTLALLFWCVLLVSLTRFYSTGSRVDFGVIVLVLLGLTYTHKLPLLVIFIAFAGLFAVLLVRNQHLLKWTEYEMRIGLILVLLATIILVIQQLYITNFLSFVVLKLTQLLAQDGAAIRPAPPTFSHAEIIDPGLGGVVHRQLYAVVLIPLSGIAWLYTAYKFRDKPAVDVILVCAAVTVAFVAVGLVATSDIVAPYRGTLFAEPILMSLVAVGLGALLRSRKTQWGAVLVMGLLLTSQVLTPVAIPDYDDSTRIYLTSGEVEAKSFGYQYVSDPIYTDSFMNHEDIRPLRSVDGFQKNQYLEMNTSLFNRSISESEYEYIMYRDIETYSSEGGWVRLTWDPTSDLRRDFSEVYTNGYVSLYHNETVVGSRQQIN